MTKELYQGPIRKSDESFHPLFPGVTQERVDTLTTHPAVEALAKLGKMSRAARDVQTPQAVNADDFALQIGLLTRGIGDLLVQLGFTNLEFKAALLKSEGVVTK